MKTKEVTIIGAGVAGLSAAIELKKLGYKVVVYERESEAGGTPRHCGHTGFGIYEFKNMLSGPKYAKKLVDLANKVGVEIKLNHILTKIEDNTLTFSTPDGEKREEFEVLLLATGARETPRSDRLISGIRSPNIITTGTLQRFAYMQELKPFEKAVIVGSEIVSFSALMTAKHLGVEIVAFIEEKEHIDTFSPIKFLVDKALGVPVLTSAKIDKIYGENKYVKGVTITQNKEQKNIECDGVIFSGLFTPESAIAQQCLEHFNYTNNSLELTQNFQSLNGNIFIAGNAVRGALSAYKCYFEGQKVAKFIDNYFKTQTEQNIVPISVDKNIYWYYPTTIDLNQPFNKLTSLRVKQKIYGTFEVLLNGRRVYRRQTTALPYKTLDIEWGDIELKEGDKIEIRVIEE